MMDVLTFVLVFVGATGVSATIFLLLERPKLRKQPDPRTLTLMKQMGDLRIEVADLRDLYERLMTSHKRLRSSAGMAKLRAMEKEEEPAGTDFDQLRKLGLIKGRTL